MKERDNKLLEKVGKYYFLYKEYKSLYRGDESALNKLFSSDAISSDVSELTRSYLLVSLFKYIIHSLNKIIEKARKKELKYREFTINFDRGIHGPVDIPRTIATLPSGIYAYYTFREGYNAPEYAILSYLARRMYVIGEKHLMVIKKNLEKIEYFRNRIKEIEKEFNELENNLSNFSKNEYFRPVTPSDPEWLWKAYKLYTMMEDLEKTEIGVRSDKVSTDRKMLKLILWKLYEVYVFFLFVVYLEKRGYKISYKNGTFVAEKENKILHLYLNSNIRNLSKLKKVNNDRDLENYQGRPDISISDARNAIIVECKYSTNLSYITSGRFKIMAYAYEYDPLTAILVYPGLEGSESPRDSEEESTMKLDDHVKHYGFVDFEFHNGKKLFIVHIDPLKKDSENLENINKILKYYNNF